MVIVNNENFPEDHRTAIIFSPLHQWHPPHPTGRFGVVVFVGQTAIF